MATLNPAERLGAPSMEERLDAGEEVCIIGGEFFEQGDEVVPVEGGVACRAHADACAVNASAECAP